MQCVFGDEVDHPGHDEEPRRDHFHATEGGPPLGVGRRVTRLERGSPGGDHRVERQWESSRPCLRKPYMHTNRPMRNTTVVATTAATAMPSETPASCV